MRNPIHNYFSKENNKYAKCITCSALLSAPNRNTTNLIAHLKRKHEKIYQKFLKEKKKRLEFNKWSGSNSKIFDRFFHAFFLSVLLS